MWEFKYHNLDREPIRIHSGGVAVSYDYVINAWQNNADFRSVFIEFLAKVPMDGFRWETTPVLGSSAGTPFEFVLIDSPTLPRVGDPGSFANQFATLPAAESVLEFSNLGRDATLIVPRSAGDVGAYGHLAAFMRGGPDQQKQELWKVVGREMAARVGGQPVWLSTAGFGVPWLHIRLDDSPKYYSYSDYVRGW